jgi:DNA-binding response OmpR family regulator
MTQRCRVLLVEDDPLLRGSLQEFLALSGFDITAVASGEEYITALQDEEYQVTLIDLGLPDCPGSDLVSWTRDHTDAAVIIITATDSIETRINSYDLGADIFFAKPIDSRELASAIRSLSRRHVPRLASSHSRPAAQTARMEEKRWILDICHRRIDSPHDGSLNLTGKEFALIHCLFQGGGQVVEKQKILNDIYGIDNEYTRRSLDTLIRRLRRKIEPISSHRGTPILNEHGIGFFFCEPLQIIGREEAIPAATLTTDCHP